MPSKNCCATGHPSKEFYNLIKGNFILIGGVNQTVTPKQNAVPEKMVRDLTRQLMVDCGEIKSVQSVKEIQQFFNKKKKGYNDYVKPIKSLKGTPVASHKGLIEVKKDEPYLLACYAVLTAGSVAWLTISEGRKKFARATCC